jgi:ABC-type uncharacterized transport system involved in gliding motility auxiliary subunit
MGAKKRFSAAIKLLLLGFLGLALLLAGQSWFTHMRIDLTEDKVFTLSDGTRNIVRDLEQPVELLFFYSEKAMRETPTLRNFAQRIENVLEEFVLLSDGRLELKKIDPEPFSEMEDRAAELGMQAVPVRVGAPQLYLGLAAVGANGTEEVITFFHPNRQQFLEYDIAKAIYLAAREAPPKIGLISGLPVNGGLDMASRSMNRPWASVQQLQQLYDIADLGPSPLQIPEDVDLLLVVHPASVGEQALYAIDQFVLSGRNAIVFVDPFAETAAAEPGSVPMPGSVPTASGLPRLFTAWGVEMVPDKVLGDAAHAMLVNIADDQPPARNLTLLGLGEANIASGELVTEGLDTLNVSSTGVWRTLENATTEWRDLVWSSKAAALIEVSSLEDLMDPNRLFDSFVPDGVTHVIAGQLSGEVSSAFPEGKPAIAADTSTDDAADSGPDMAADEPVEDQQNAEMGLQRGTINVLLVADTDLLTDRLWVQAQTFFGQPVLSPFADNGSLLINAADYLVGSGDLISIRGRGTYNRPFTRVHEIQRAAEEDYRATADELSAQLEATERKLTELQQLKSGEDKQVLSPEQEQAVDQFLAQKLEIRKSLREVQHQLTSDIETLGTRLKLINIGLIPVLLTIVMLAFSLLRRRRQY